MVGEGRRDRGSNQGYIIWISINWRLWRAAKIMGMILVGVNSVESFRKGLLLKASSQGVCVHSNVKNGSIVNTLGEGRELEELGLYT